VPVYTLPGNHDYYSGGEGFYGMIPQLNQDVPNATVQQHSFWSLVNDAWQLEGLDTGYHDSDLLEVGEDTTHLRDDEAAWHTQQLAKAGNRKVILFSHHQLYSTLEAIGGAWRNPKLEDNLAAWQAVTPNLVGWLWGHEHVLGIYQVPGSQQSPASSPPLPILGRCIGNGAFPVFTDSGYVVGKDTGVALLAAKSSPDGKIAFPSGFVQSQPDSEVWASGYAVLELPDVGPATARYYQVQFAGTVQDATSQLLWEEPIGAPVPAIDLSGATLAPPQPAAG
jgi:hypothetical protein